MPTTETIPTLRTLAAARTAVERDLAYVQAQRWPWWVRATMTRDLEARQARLWWQLRWALAHRCKETTA
jgi:hypothetical protein